MSTEFKDSQIQNRRSADHMPSGHTPTLIDVWTLLTEIRDRLDALERNFDTITTAFPIDDLKKPDYAGHRRQHVEITKGDELMDGYKHDATKQIIVIIVTFVIGLIASGFVTKIAGLLK